VSRADDSPSTHVPQLPLSAREITGPIDECMELLDEIATSPITDPARLQARVLGIREQLGAISDAVSQLAQLTEVLAELSHSAGLHFLTRGDNGWAGSVRALQEQRELAEIQAVRAVRDLKTLRANVKEETAARNMAEAQQLRAIQDFRTEHRRALQLADRLREAYLQTITALARSVEARDEYTGGHVERVRRYSLRIGHALELPEETQMHLEFGSVLHDVGKIGVPDIVLRKDGPLDNDEWQYMRRHPIIGQRVLEGVLFLIPALDVVAYHHEKWDGTGYPYGLAGEAIPLLGRIVSVADAFDAMTSDRPYRKGLPVEVALAELEKSKGKHFDPQVIDVFVADPPAVAA
jgi:HD-GYP domain-containing protein (c-di-GMP phosphodiesterase class II)